MYEGFSILRVVFIYVTVHIGLAFRESDALVCVFVLGTLVLYYLCQYFLSLYLLPYIRGITFEGLGTLICTFFSCQCCLSLYL